MRKTVLTLATVFSMFCFVACGGETQDDVSTVVKEDVVVGNATNTPTAKPPVVEATAEPTEKPMAIVTANPEEVVTAEPTESKEPAENPSVVYEGVDMESNLPGEEWVETFVGIIEEPKLVVFSDETGRKEIFEKDSIIKFNPETDMIGIYFPEGYKCRSEVLGVGQIEMGHMREKKIEFTFVTVPE